MPAGEVCFNCEGFNAGGDITFNIFQFSAKLPQISSEFIDSKQTPEQVSEHESLDADELKEALSRASIDLLAWERMLPGGRWIDRPEKEKILRRFAFDASSTVLLGEPGSGKSALLSKIASDLRNQGCVLFALKADFLSAAVRNEVDLRNELQLPDLPSDMICSLAKLQPVYVFIDQLDALASYLDLQSGRLNVLLNLIRRIGNIPNVHVLISARTFEFNHDARLKNINAEEVMLELPPWQEVKARLSEVGIDPDSWPEKARDVV